MIAEAEMDQTEELSGDFQGDDCKICFIKLI